MKDKYAKRRARSSAASTIVGISLVLFMIGAMALLLLNARKLSIYVKENIQLQVFVNDQVKEVDIIQLKKTIDAESYPRETKYVSKEEAAESLQKDLGEDFIAFLGYNPLLPSIDIKLKADYAHPDSMEWIAKSLQQNTAVHEVAYSPDLIQQVYDNVNRITLILLVFSGLLLLVAIALINNTIRLAMYARRFTIRSMQLVGATSWFIKKPFLGQGLLHGIYGSIIAIGMLGGLIYLAQHEMPEFFELQDLQTFAMVFAIVLATGIIISITSTLFAVQRYLRLKLDDLY
jgi:cell division transport system permease protein